MKCVSKIALFLAFLLSVNLHAIPISATALSDLDFGSAVQGDIAKSVPPGTSENISNGSFRVDGDPNRVYTIVLPANATMITGAGGANQTISLSSFQSFPLSASAVLDATGTQTVYIGATRAALSLTQVPGAYAGTYVLTVVY